MREGLSPSARTAQNSLKLLLFVARATVLRTSIARICNTLPMPESDTLHGLRAQWEIDDKAQPLVANQLLVRFGTPPFSSPNVPDAVYLTFGHMNPVLFNLEPGAAPSQDDIDRVVLPVMPVAHMAVSVDRLRDFVGQIQQVIEQFDANQQGQ